MTKYRIKVFPSNGTLLYMPQQRIWFFWCDLWQSCDGEYMKWVQEILSSEHSALECIKQLVVQELREKEVNNYTKKFERDNPVRYIKVDL